MYWISGYTGLTHKLKEKVGAWAYVECQQFSIPGQVQEYCTTGSLCPICFPSRKDSDVKKANQ